MKYVLKAFICSLAVMVVFLGCTKKQTKFPDTRPEEVASRFFKLLADGGRLSNQEAFKMVSTKYGAMNIDSFRKWTENYGTGQAKLKVVQTVLPKEPNKNGDWIAVVKLEVSTPSIFGDNAKTSSQLNLILDEKANEWQIDFNADTIDESGFLKESPTANGTELATKAGGTK